MTVEILHLASFSGNIGDIANHEGFYSQIRKIFNKEVKIKQLEMRKFYKNWREMKFDNEFADLANKYDLLIIGGGGFFDLCWDYSATGTSLDISCEVLAQINTPIFINAIGVDISRNPSNEVIRKFGLFLEGITKKDNIFITVRNDGSYTTIKKLYPKCSERIFKIPDHGFFVSELDKIKQYQPVKKVKSIGFNFAFDLKEFRYSKVTYDYFIEKIGGVIQSFLLNSNYNIYFIAHIQTDYKVFVDIIETISERNLRTRISITPIIQGQEIETIKYYKECEAIFGMRFHTNVCAISMGIPTLGIATLPKSGDMYEEIGLPHRAINITEPLFFEKLIEEMNKVDDDEYLTTLHQAYKNSLSKVYEEKNEVYLLLKDWLKEQNIL
ncbi:polysaccharide pyruvyl transferase family protein [Bacillus sp. Hm123]|uniref:polysaccharide pyruvyl transferase family protein n=1 Tax=Bacillus sp. Hm123 TaxID=3450745 RepID=UPI003F430438